MLPTLLKGAIASILFTTASSQRIEDELSFGHKERLAPDGTNIPGWRGSSANHNMQILSDRVMLTPPFPDHAKGALWTERQINSETWIADMEFRASGQEPGSGNLNFWFAKDKNQINMDSLYTVGNFEGLLITIDQYGGTGGKIRGFLNDGTQNFKSQPSLEKLAFGHCDYHYRNLGRPSKFKVTSLNGLSVTIDDKPCFSSDKISLPSNYYFGISASTAEQPDSFEVKRFVVQSNIPHTHEHVVKGGPPPITNQGNQQQQPQSQRLDKLPGAPEMVPDKSPSEIRSQDDQFADLHNRLQTLSHQIAMLSSEISEIGKRLPTTANTNTDNTNPPPSNPGLTDELTSKLTDLTRRLTNIETTTSNTAKHNENIERIVEYTKKGFDNIEKLVGARDYHAHFESLNQALDTMTASAPRMGFFVVVIVGVQVGLAVGYVVWKRRRGGMPKKYL